MALLISTLTADSGTLQTAHTEVDFGVNLTPTTQVGGNLGYVWTDNGSGKDEHYPSVEEKFEDQTAAFDETVSFLVPQFSLAHDNAMPTGLSSKEDFILRLEVAKSSEQFRAMLKQKVVF